MITAEVLNAGEADKGLAEIEIYCDEAGLLLLKRQIELMLAGESHVHLMTPAWAGTELSEVPLGKGVLVNHIRVTKVQ